MFESMKNRIEENPEAFKKVAVTVGVGVGLAVGVAVVVILANGGEGVPFDLDDAVPDASS